MSSVVERFDRLVDKLPAFTPVEVADVRRFTRAGEWQLALDLLVATAIKRKRSLSPEVYAEVCDLAPLVNLEQPERFPSSDWSVVFKIVDSLLTDERFTKDNLRFVVWSSW